MFFKLEEAETNVISISIGKKYLCSLVDSYNLELKDKEELHKEINSFINGINDKNVVNNFRLNKKRRFLISVFIVLFRSICSMYCHRK